MYMACSKAATRGFADWHRWCSQCTWCAGKLQREDLLTSTKGAVNVQCEDLTWRAAKLQREDLLTSTEGAVNVHGVQGNCSVGIS